MDTPDDHQVEVRGRLIRKTLSEMQAQIKAIKGEVLATEASKQMTCGQAAKSSHRDAKDSGEKLQKLKPKPATSYSQDDQSTAGDFPLDNFKGTFEAMTNPDNHEPSQSQQEPSGPTDPSSGKLAQEALNPGGMIIEPSPQQSQHPASLNVSQSSLAFNASSLDQITPLSGIAPAPDVIAATAIATAVTAAAVVVIMTHHS